MIGFLFRKPEMPGIDRRRVSALSAMSPDDTDRAFARCFATREGEIVLAWLERTCLMNTLAPEAGEGALRHAEGQRALVMTILRKAARGREAPAARQTRALNET